MEVECVVRPDQGYDPLQVVVRSTFLDGIVVDDSCLPLAFFDVILLTPEGTARHDKINNILSGKDGGGGWWWVVESMVHAVVGGSWCLRFAESTKKAGKPVGFRGQGPRAPPFRPESIPGRLSRSHDRHSTDNRTIDAQESLPQ